MSQTVTLGVSKEEVHKIPGGQPAKVVLTSQRLRLSWTGTAGAPLLWFWRSPRVSNAAVHFPIKALMAKMSTNDARWNKRLDELRLFAKNNGGKAHVPQRDPERRELGNWCMTQARRSSPARQLIEEAQI